MIPSAEATIDKDHDGGGSGSNIVVRQLLTARKGQRPNVWIDFNEARDIMLGWEGYKMMLVKRNVEEMEFRYSILTIES